jgi:hypothetical protein
MANAPAPIHASSALGQWVEDLYGRIFFQPNDEVSASAYDEVMAQEFIAR